jgi:hypothetical protein
MKTIASLASCLVAFCFVSNAQAVPITFIAHLSGAAELPANSSPGTGTATAIYNDSSRELTLDVTFSGLLEPTTVAHIHAPVTVPFGTSGVAVTPGTLPDFPAGVTSGTYSRVLDLSNAAVYQATFFTASGGTTAGAEASLIASMMSSRAYFNIHSSLYPAGEIRGFFAPVAVPEPGALSLLLIGLLGAAVVGKRAAR